jgi:hypothetical protein
MLFSLPCSFPIRCRLNRHHVGRVDLYHRRMRDQIFNVVRLGEGLILRFRPSIDRLLRRLLAVVDCRVEQRFFPRRQRARSLQIVAGAGQPVANEFARSLINTVCDPWRALGETRKPASICSGQHKRAWERARPWENPTRSNSGAPVAYAGWSFQRCRGQ